MGSVARMTRPYRAAMKKEWQEMLDFYMDQYECFGFPLSNVTKDSVFHIAVHSRNVKLLNDLLEINAEALLLPNLTGNTALHEAAAYGNVEMAELLIMYDEKETKPGGQRAVDINNHIGETPLFRAAAFGRTQMVEFLAKKVGDNYKSFHRRRKDGMTILHMAVLSRCFDTALKVLEWEDMLGDWVDENGMTCLQLLANMPSAFKSGYPMSILKRLLYLCLPDEDKFGVGTPVTSSGREEPESGRYRSSPGRFRSLNACIATSWICVWKCIAQEFPDIRELWNIKSQHKSAVKFVKLLATRDLTWMRIKVGEKPEQLSIFDNMEENESNDGKVSRPQDPEELPRITNQDTASLSEAPLISAARNGIIEIVEVILQLYPQAIEHKNDRGENILHVVARHGRKEIMHLLQHSHALRSRLRRTINNNGDSILHQAAYFREHELTDRPGEALLMQSEIQWFKQVRKIVPPYFINHRNNQALTAEELFTKQHQELVENGRKWIDQTTKACTIVAVLIATVAFTCAYTIPGGSNSKTGHPLLLEETPFRTFAVSDTLSLCFSLTSVVVFLSIMTSRMHERDFRRSLPLKIAIGLSTLFFSVTAMMVAFAATLVLMIQQRLHWAAIPIYTLACFPVTIFLVLQFPLYLNIVWFTVSDLLLSFVDLLPSGTSMVRNRPLR
ncbi:uncharacterized protein LOC121264270 isoform X2 [Juglans microcarpa x Juglans regia]|uniref:uncharacterized protein LOC121264270 isoform X2 n=1 Tax=Juglans microcarpa x Juglans regia TaxID=2249226 RepID=UPI001B7F0661|nr:uncharacterized protein LOC121264270 isoform X2 [Juglans microcarpa x Juglans regia]